MRDFVEHAVHEEGSVWEYPAVACHAFGGIEEAALPAAAAVFCSVASIRLVDDILDVEIFEKYIPAIEQLKIPFIIQDRPNQVLIRDEFSIRREKDENIRSFVRSMDCALVF